MSPLFTNSVFPLIEQRWSAPARGWRRLSGRFPTISRLHQHLAAILTPAVSEFATAPLAGNVNSGQNAQQVQNGRLAFAVFFQSGPTKRRISSAPARTASKIPRRSKQKETCRDVSSAASTDNESRAGLPRRCQFFTAALLRAVLQLPKTSVCIGCCSTFSFVSVINRWGSLPQFMHTA